MISGDGIGSAGGRTRNGVGPGGKDSSNNKLTDELFRPRSIGDDLEELDGDDSMKNEVFTPRKWNGFNIR